MQTLAIVGVAAAVAVGAAFATVQFATPQPAAPAGDAEAQHLRRDVDDLRRQLAELRAAPAPATAAAPTDARTVLPQLTDEQIESALSRYLAARGGKLPMAASGDGTDGGAVDVTATLAQLRGKSDFWSHSDLYRRLFAAGKMDELIAAFEDYAAQNPKDVQAQMDLGNAYLAYLQMDSTKYPLSAKADAAFDRVLAIDENHWAARFTKAVSYTFYPDFLGKGPEAISHFERLIKQQQDMPPRPEFAQTYFFLGNLLESRKEPERARQIWEQGLRLHPNDENLRKKLGR
jgi:tetratricopeptide (TPR) repeat protein